MGVINSTFEFVSSPSTSHSFSFDATGSNCLYISVAFDAAAAYTFTDVTYNGVSATAVPSASDETGRSIYLFRLLAPATGANTLVVDWDGTQSGMVISVLALDAVNQTTPETGAGAIGGTGTSITTPVILRQLRIRSMHLAI